MSLSLSLWQALVEDGCLRAKRGKDVMRVERIRRVRRYWYESKRLQLDSTIIVRGLLSLDRCPSPWFITNHSVCYRTLLQLPWLIFVFPFSVKHLLSIEHLPRHLGQSFEFHKLGQHLSISSGTSTQQLPTACSSSSSMLLGVSVSMMRVANSLFSFSTGFFPG